jgi:large subunit ribosomal protein L4
MRIICRRITGISDYGPWHVLYLWSSGGKRRLLWAPRKTIQPRSYTYQLPKKVERGALKAALMARLSENAVVVVDELKASERKTKAAAELLKRLGATGKTLVVDVALDENFHASARNIRGVHVVASGRLTARDVMDSTRVVATRAALERLQEVLG